MNQILEHIPTEMKRAGQEYAGPCPWCGGHDRFTLSPEEDGGGLYWCRRCERGGDAITLLRDLHGLSFAEACERLGRTDRVEQSAFDAVAPELGSRKRKKRGFSKPSAPLPIPSHTETTAPKPAWQETARSFVKECQQALWTDTALARKARQWLFGRGFTEKTIRVAGLGLNSRERHPKRSTWSLTPKKNRTGGGTLWLPRGITIPWTNGGVLWKVNIRRFADDVVPGHSWKSRKYQLVAGSANALYNADALQANRPAVIVEGEFDALAVQQAIGQDASAVATGSTQGARRVRYIGRLAACPAVLVAFDADEAGEEAARYWTDLMPHAQRWRPYWSDPAAMLESDEASEDAALLRTWITTGLQAYEGEKANKNALTSNEIHLEKASIQWAWPPCAADWLAWMPDASRSAAPSGLMVKQFCPSVGDQARYARFSSRREPRRKPDTP